MAVIVVCFVLATPRNGGPDEASHMVTSAGLLRGERSGTDVEGSTRVRAFEVPAFVGRPDPACWAQQPTIPASCAVFDVTSTETTTAVSSAVGYPPWSYVLPGLASFIPVPNAYNSLSRLLMAAIPILLLATALDRLRDLGRGTRTAALVGVTPIAWFTMGIVNPSAVAVAGGFALWVGLLTMRPDRGHLLVIAGWACVLLPRRDGPFWATLIVFVACLALSTDPVAVWRRLGRWPRIAAALLALVPVATLLISMTPGTEALDLLLAATPIGLLAMRPVTVWQSRASHPRIVLGAVVALVAAAVVALLAVARRDGLEAEVVRLIVGNTGNHLRQLVGVLGWLDTPVPLVAVLVVFGLVGALLAVAALEQPRFAWTGAGALVAVVCSAWVLEFGHGSDYGQYWQGRYSLPFWIGVPLVLAVRGGFGRITGSRSLDVLAPGFAGAIWFVWNLGFVAAIQRWGVGTSGSWLPWKWDTWGAPLPTSALLVIHTLASAWLLIDTARHDVSVDEQRQPTLTPSS